MDIRESYSLKKRNTFGMNVSCACYVEYGSVEELVEFFSSGRQHGLPLPFLHIGGGSNILFTGDFPGTVFHSGIRFISEIRPCGTTAHDADGPGSAAVLVEVGAGTLWDDFCAWCAERGLWGPENLSGIPGETGAAAVQNIGAYGVEFKDVVREVRCFDAVTCSIKTFRQQECKYGYRDSIFKQSAKGRYIVTSVVFGLSTEGGPRLEYGHVKSAVENALWVGQKSRSDRDWKEQDPPNRGCRGLGWVQSFEERRLRVTQSSFGSPSPSLVRSVILGIRDSKLPDPEKTGSAGSFFKNPVVPKIFYEKVEHYAKSKYGQDYEVPHFDAGSGFVKIPAAWLIDQCGWKGYREGNVGVYEKQPLVLVNLTGKALPGEIVALEKKIAASVLNLFGIGLEPEVEHI